jgi:hypothetical protein
MRNLFSGLFYKWVLITLFNSVVFSFLDYIFSTNTSLTFLDAGFLAFVILWCEQQDRIKREGK